MMCQMEPTRPKLVLILWKQITMFSSCLILNVDAVKSSVFSAIHIANHGCSFFGAKQVRSLTRLLVMK